MKKSKTILSLAAVALSLGLTGCAHECEATCYGIGTTTKTDDGMVVAKIDVKVNKGKFTSLSIDETYTPSLWARVTDADAATLGNDYFVEVDGIKYAKYISVNGLIWEAAEREDDDAYASYNEPVRYFASTSDKDSTYDLIRHLAVQDASTYKLGSIAKIYYEDVNTDNIKIVKSVTKDQETKNIISFEFSDVVKPQFPEGKKYRSQRDSAWKSSIDALTRFFVGKAFNYKSRVENDDMDRFDTLRATNGTWEYNHKLTTIDPSVTGDALNQAVADANANGWETITGCETSAINANEMEFLFNNLNQAFASIEYESIA